MRSREELRMGPGTADQRFNPAEPPRAAAPFFTGPTPGRLMNRQDPLGFAVKGLDQLELPTVPGEYPYNRPGRNIVGGRLNHGRNQGRFRAKNESQHGSLE